MVGQSLLPLLADAGFKVIAYSRQSRPHNGQTEFRRLPHSGCELPSEQIDSWVSLAPIWTLREHSNLLAAHGAKRIVVLSSTSIFTKNRSPDPGEQRTAGKLACGESELVAWAQTNGIDWVILRPTLIYGKGLDRNIGEIARFISRFGFFPLLGKAAGLRQPVHVEDIAAASAAALLNRAVRNHAYQLSGAQTLSYREMVATVFKAMDRPERFIRIPRWLFRATILYLRILPRFRDWSVAMAERMESDLVFDHTEATGDFGYLPRPFRLDDIDLPSQCRNGGRAWL